MPLSLLLGVHAHQPVGNFPAVIDDAHVRCYGMFLRVMENYPDFRFSVHFSGWLLDYLLERFPGDMDRLAAMTRRGQVEWFGSGDCEPVLAAIPHRDRVSQIATLSDKIERRFGVRPRGAWLTERVWESSVVPALAETGIDYVAVDDYHFLCAGEAMDRLDGHFTTEEDGRRLDLFPIAEAARYRLPFSPAEETVAWLEDLARRGRRAAIYFDDIEKFGIWPETYQWVYERGWLTRFVEGVLASPLIRTESYADFHAREATRGIVYLPTTSYIEMNEWTLPGPRAAEYHALLEAEKAAGRFEAHKPFLRGGIWRNFMSRYPEANWMHKRMLEVSARLAALPAGQRTPEMQEHLHRAQANDAYWHGLFGGLYLPHLRRAVWHHLLALDALLGNAVPNADAAPRDIDADGHVELPLRSGELLAIVRDDGDAALVEFSSLALAHNFGDTLRRHEEGYHARLAADESQSPRDGGDGGKGGEGIASAHDRVAFLHAIAPEDTLPDPRPRGIAVDGWIAADGARLALDAYRREGEAFVCAADGLRVEKRYELAGDTLHIRYRCAGTGTLETVLNLAMPSCDGYGGRYVLADGNIPCGFGQDLAITGETLRLEDSELGGALSLAVTTSGDSTSPAPALRGRPHRTVSQSEAGFEKVMQAVELTLAWPVAGALDITLSLRVTAAPA